MDGREKRMKIHTCEEQSTLNERRIRAGWSSREIIVNAEGK